jgi:hypothetical protein
MARALHPELAKRIMFTDTLGNAWIRDMGATELIRNTRSGGGTKTQNAASVRVDAGGWIDYLHLVKWRGKWAIINVLWELRPPPGAPR